MKKEKKNPKRHHEVFNLNNFPNCPKEWVTKQTPRLLSGDLM